MKRSITILIIILVGVGTWGIYKYSQSRFFKPLGSLQNTESMTPTLNLFESSNNIDSPTTAITPTLSPKSKQTQPPTPVPQSATVSGKVAIGPTCYYESCYDTRNFENMMILVYSGSNKSNLIRSLPVNSDGTFSFTLPPGTYTFDIANYYTDAGATKNTPLTYSLSSGTNTTLYINIVTGR